MSAWRYQMGISEILNGFDDLGFEAVRDAVALAVHQSMRHESGAPRRELDAIATALESSETVAEFDAELAGLYDWGDANRVWIT